MTRPHRSGTTRKPFCVNRPIRVSRGGKGLAGGRYRPKKDAALVSKALKEALGEQNVSDDLAERRLYDHDIAPSLSILEMTFRSIPDAVARPRDAAQVSEVLRLANRLRFPVVPRGAATWGLGGAVPATGGVVLDLTSLDKVVDIDVERCDVAVEAGATWQKAIEAARKRGLHIGTYPSSYPAATVGGWIGVGGVGIGTCRYGRISENLRSLQVVLPDGSIIESAKKGARYPLETFVGTEGIFGIVTRANLRAYPMPETISPVSFAFPGLAQAAGFMGTLSSKIAPMHVMFADKANFEWLEAAGIHTGVESALVTVVLEGSRTKVDAEAAGAEEHARLAGGTPQPPERAAREWRERSYEFRMRLLGTGTLPGEVIIPVSEFGPAVEETYALMRRHKLSAAVIGTLADKGTFMLMPYYLIDERHPLRTQAAMTFNYRLAELAFRHGGRPVGLGMYFQFLLPRMFPAADIAGMRAQKKQLDPNGILNPGKMLEGRYGSGRSISPWASRLTMKFGTMLRAGMGQERLPKKHESGRLADAKEKGG